MVAEGEQKLVWLIESLFQYAQVIKQQRGFRLVGVEHRMLWGKAEEHHSALVSKGADQLPAAIKAVGEERLKGNASLLL